MIDTVLNIWQIILTSNLFNFVVMLVILGWIIKHYKISDKMESGRKQIEDKIATAKTTRKESLKTLFEVQEEGKKIEQDSLKIMEDSDKNAVVVGKKIVDEARKQSEEYSENIKKTIETNINNTRKNVTNETALSALNLAKEQVENELKENRELHIKYINESIENLKNLPL